MDITLNIAELVNDIGATYMMGTKSGDTFPPEGKMMLAIEEAFSEMNNTLSLYISSVTEVANTSKTYTFNFSPRKAVNKELSLKSLMHSYVVNGAMARVYADMSLPEMAAVYLTKQEAGLATFRQIVHKKKQPTYED